MDGICATIRNRGRESMAILRTTNFNVVYDKKENLSKILRLVEEAGKEGVDLIVFPEGALQGYIHKRIVDKELIGYHIENAETLQGESVEEIKKLAQKYDINVVFGMIERHPDDRGILYNSSVLVRPDGFVGAYQKVHQPSHETYIFHPGTSWPVFDTHIGRIGMLVCYDKAFPEAGRSLALQGAEILVMPTAWPLMHIGSDPATDERGEMYDLLDKVRALENQSIFIGSNLVGVTGEFDYYGHSRIVSPLGQVISEIGYEEGYATADLDLEKVLSVGRMDHRLNNMFKNRRPATYTL